MQLIDVESSDEHLKLLYLLLGERPEHANISHKEMPSFEEHTLFVNSAPYYKWLIIEDCGKLVGSVYITFDNEIGIAVLNEHSGMGYASMALEKIISTLDPLQGEVSKRSGGFVANIAPSNDRSIALFKRVGFEHVSNVYKLEG